MGAIFTYGLRYFTEVYTVLKQITPHAQLKRYKTKTNTVKEKMSAQLNPFFLLLFMAIIGREKRI